MVDGKKVRLHMHCVHQLYGEEWSFAKGKAYLESQPRREIKDSYSYMYIGGIKAKNSVGPLLRGSMDSLTSCREKDEAFSACCGIGFTLKACS